MRKHLVLSGLVFTLMLFVFSCQASAEEIVSGKEYSFFNPSYMSWLTPSGEEALTWGNGGNNYDSQEGKFELISAGSDTWTIKYGDRIIVGNTTDFTVKLLPSSTSSNLDGATWKLVFGGEIVGYYLECVSSRAGLCLTPTGEGFSLFRPSYNNRWDIHKVDSNIVFEERFRSNNFNFWNKELGSLYSPGELAVNTLANTKDYNINKNLNAFSYKDYVLEGKVKPKFGSAGLIFRNDGTNMYLWSLNRTSKLAELFTVNIATGNKTKLKSKSITISTDIDKWYSEKIIVKDNKMLLYVDDVLVDTAEDNTSSNGLIGYWLEGDELSGNAFFKNIVVRKDIPSIIYQSKDKAYVDDKVTPKVDFRDDITDLNAINIKPLSTSNYWIPFTEDLNVRSNGVERYLFQASVDVPENITNLALSKDSTSTLQVDDKLSVFVNGRRVASEIKSFAQPVLIDRKYLMPGAKNDVLIILYDTQKDYTGLTKLKITKNLDTSYNMSKVIEYNGFKILYDETTPLNSKIIKYPSNIIIDGSLQMVSADVPTFDEYGNVITANFSAKLTGSVYKYNGWNKYKKLFSANADSTLDISINDSEYGNFSEANFKNVKFEIAQFDSNIFDLTQYVASTDAKVNEDQSISLIPKAKLKILGETKTCDLILNIDDSKLHIEVAGRINLNQFVNVSKRSSTYDEASDLELSGGFDYNIFEDKLNNYAIKIDSIDGAQIRLNIPKFAEIYFSGLTMTDSTITVDNMGMNFSKDCIFDGLKPSEPKNYAVSFTQLSINKNATSLANVIKSCTLSVTVNNETEVFKSSGMSITSGSKFTGGVTGGVFTIGFDGKFILPDADKTNVTAKFSVDTKGNVAFSGNSTFQKLNFMGLDFKANSTDPANIGFQFVNSVYENNVQKSPKKFIFTFKNVGTDFTIKDAGTVKVLIKQFVFNTDGKIDSFASDIQGDIKLFNDNVIITTGTGNVNILYDATKEYTLDAQNVSVNFPNIGDKPGLKTTASLKLNTLKGLENFELKTGDQLKVFDGFVIVNNPGVSIENKSGVYSLQLNSSNVVCDVYKAVPSPSLKDTKLEMKNFILRVNNLSSPSFEIECDQVAMKKDFELDLGIKFQASGITVKLKGEKSITINDPIFTLPSFGGLEYYKDKTLQEKVNNLVIAPAYLSVVFNNSSWGFEMGKVTLPGASVYNLFELNVCKVILEDLSMEYNKGNFEIRIKSAIAKVESGYSSELTDVKITNDDVSIGGGSITIPELSLGGIGVQNFTATFGKENIEGKEYSYIGGACSVTIPGLAAVDGKLIVQLYDDNFFGIVKEASFQLTLAKSIPLGTTGLSLKTIRGSLTRGALPANFPSDFSFMFGTGTDLKVVSMGIGLVDGSSGGKVLKLDADVWVELTNWGFAMDASASIFEGFVQAKAGIAYANEIFAARAQVRVLCLEGKVIMYVYPYEGKTSMSGEGSVSVRLDAGKILNKKIWRWRIKIPRSDIWYEGLGAKFGRFTNGKVGFQVSVNFPILGKMSAFVGDGGLKFFTNYSIYIPTITKKTVVNPDVLALGALIAPRTLAASSTASSDTPTYEDIIENNKKTGVRLKFTNKDSLERMILSASTTQNIPSFTIYRDGAIVPINNNDRIKTEIKESEEVVEEVVGEQTVERVVGTGISNLLSIENPETGNWVIEARSDEEVYLSLVTKLSESSLKINSSQYNGTNTLTVSGQVINPTLDANGKVTEKVTLALKSVDKSGQNKVVPQERVVATSKTLSDMDGIMPITIANDGRFTSNIDTTIMRTGSYSLVAEIERKVTSKVDDKGEPDPNGTATQEFDVSGREDYQENGAIKVYDFVNTTLPKITNLKASVSSYGSNPNYKYNLDVSFKNSTKTADGYLLFAECFVDGVSKGTRKINIGNVSRTRIGQFTEYYSVTDATYKPVEMVVSVIPYKYKDPSLGFVYDFGGNLGFKKVTNNIELGTKSNEERVWIKRNTDTILTSCTSNLTEYQIPVEGSKDGELTINVSKSGKVLLDVVDENKSANVIFIDDIVDINLAQGSTTGSIKVPFNLVSNIEAKDASKTESIRVRISNASNPDDYKIVTLQCKFTVPVLTVKEVYPGTINRMTGGTIDIYGTSFLKGTKVTLGGVELEILPYESGNARIAAKIPENFSLKAGKYDLKVTGPSNSVVWGTKISLIDTSYEWVNIRDTGKVQKGSNGKFYFRLASKTGYMGSVGIRVKSKPDNWNVSINKSMVKMDEEVEVTVTVPSTEALGDISISIEGMSSVANSVYMDVYKDLGVVKVSVVNAISAPSINSLSKSKAMEGEVITIYGDGFNAQSIVELVTPSGNKSVTIQSREGNLLKVIVPTGTTSGKLRVGNSGTYSNEVPLVVIPQGMITNFDQDPIRVVMTPGETTEVTIVNNAKTMSISTGNSVVVTCDNATGKVKLSVPMTAGSGEYDVFVNINYPNTVVQQRITVYVVKDGVTSEDLSRKVILTGRNLNIKVQGKNVSSFKISSLTVNNVAISRTPNTIAGGWDIDVGMVNNGSVVKYQFSYVIGGQTVTTPVYEYKVQYPNPNSNDDIYKAMLVANPDGTTTLRVTEQGSFAPNTMKVTFGVDNGAGTTKDMIETGRDWEVSLGQLPQDSKVKYTLSFGTGVETITTTSSILRNETKVPKVYKLPYTMTRDTSGNVNITLPRTIELDGKNVNPSDVKVIFKTNTSTNTIAMTKGTSDFTGSIGKIPFGEKMDITFSPIIEGERYGIFIGEIQYKDAGFENSQNGIMAQYFDNMYFSDLRLTTLEPSIDWDFAKTPPAGGLIQDTTYSVRWSGKVQAKYTEDYTFYATTDTGSVALWVAGTKLFEGTGNQSATIKLTEAKITDFVLEYKAQTKGKIKLEWQSASQAREVIPKERQIAYPTTKPVGTEFVGYVNQVGFDFVKIGWDVPSGVTGVTSYDIYSGNSLVANTGYRGFTFNGLIANTSYTYIIKAKNASGTVLVTSQALTVKTEAAPQDLGLNKTATASSSPDSTQKPEKAVDGNSYTRWTSAAGDNEWIKVDLGGVYDIAKVRLNWATDAYAKAYTLQVSKDGVNWYDFYTISVGDGGIDDIPVSQVSGRYIKMQGITRVSSTASYSLWDINVYGYAKTTLKLQSYNEVRDAVNNNIAPIFKITNAGNQAVDLSTIKLRYYYTIDGEKVQNFRCDWSDVGASNVTGTFVKMNSPATNADYYLEIGFTTGAGTIQPGESKIVKTMFNKSDYSNYTLTNDYSFDSVSTTYQDNNKIPMYQAGTLVLGAEPIATEKNLSFNTNTSGWTCYVNEKIDTATNLPIAKATYGRDTLNYDTSPASYQVTCERQGANLNDIQLIATGFAFEKGKLYNLTFRAKSTVGFTIPRIDLMENGGSYTRYAVVSNVSVGTGWQTYSYTFKINTSNPSGRITFFLGKALPNGAKFNLDTIDFKEVSQPVELLSNPSFNMDLSGWSIYANSATGTYASFARDTAVYDTQPAGSKLSCVSNGLASTDMQLITTGLNLEAGKTYTLTFRAKASSSFIIPSIVLIKKMSPWTNYATAISNVSVTTSWQSYCYSFKVNTTDPDSRISFNLGNALPNGAQLYVDTISFREVTYNEPLELLVNPSYDVNTYGWSRYYSTSNGASAEAIRDTVDYDTSPASYKLTCTTNGNNPDDVQINGVGLSIEAGKTYKLSFKAKASSSFNIPTIAVVTRNSPWTTYNTTAISNVAINTAWQSYSYTFKTNVTDPDARLIFKLGNAIPDGAKINLDTLSLKEVQ